MKSFFEKTDKNVEILSFYILPVHKNIDSKTLKNITYYNMIYNIITVHKTLKNTKYFFRFEFYFECQITILTSKKDAKEFNVNLCYSMTNIKINKLFLMEMACSVCSCHLNIRQASTTN